MLSPRKTETNALSNAGHADKGYSNSTYAPVGGSTYNDDTGPSIVNKRLTMKGDLESDGDIHIKGKVIGNIRCKLLIVDADANVEGGVIAEEVIIRGTTKGTIQANRVRLEKTAVVESEIDHQVFSAEEGARIKGALRYNDNPLSKSGKDGLSLVA